MQTHLDEKHSSGASLRQCWSDFTEPWQAEAGDLAVNHRKFSLVQFIGNMAMFYRDGPGLAMSPHASSSIYQFSALSHQDT